MNRLTTIIIVSLFFFFLFVGIGIYRYRSQTVSLDETVPLITKKSPQQRILEIPEPAPGSKILTSTATQAGNISNNVSFAEKNKILDSLPYETESFQTSVGIKTAIIIESKTTDPISALRIGIYGINYADKNLNGKFAAAFRETFLKAREYLVGKGVNLQNLQIVYSDYQSAQDTATFWVKSFNLL